MEELQQFTRMHTPAGPSSHVVRLAIPQSCCAEAVRALVHAFGGVRWWQVRPGDGGCVVCAFPLGRSAEGCV